MPHISLKALVESTLRDYMELEYKNLQDKDADEDT